MTIKRRLERLERRAAQSQATQPRAAEHLFARMERCGQEITQWYAFCRGEGPRPPDADGRLAERMAWMESWEPAIRVALEQEERERADLQVTADDLTFAGFNTTAPLQTR